MKTLRFAAIAAITISLVVIEPPTFGSLANATGTSVRAALGSEHAVAVATDGTVWTWGALVPGPTGSGSKDSLKKPTRVSVGAKSFVDVAATNYSSTAVASDGTVWAWGTLGIGLGDADVTTARRYTDPIQVSFPAGTSITRISGACESYLALDSSGAVWQWGSFYGMWDQSSSTPSRVNGITTAVSVHRGCSSSFAILNDGTARAWGSNGGGRLGDGSTTDRSMPVAVSLPGSRDFSTISASWSHTLAAATDGTVWGWGGNSQGNLGADPTAIEYSVNPRQISLSSASGTVVSVLATTSTPVSVAVTSTGQVWEWGTWGNNSFVPVRRNLPSDMGSSKIATAVASSWNATLYPANDGAIWSRGGWGAVDLDGNCGATASDYPMWRNGTTTPARPLVRVRSVGQFGTAFAEDELSIARLETGAGALLPMDGSGTAVGQVGVQTSVVATAPVSSCFDVGELSYELSTNGGTSFSTSNITTSINSFGQTVVTAAFTPSASGRSRAILRIKNPDDVAVTYRFWLGVSAAASAPGSGTAAALPIAYETGDGQTAVAIGTDGLLYGWGTDRLLTGRTESATARDKETPRRLTTPAGVTFKDISVAQRLTPSLGAAAAAVSDDGRLFVWGTSRDDLILGNTGTPSSGSSGGGSSGDMPTTTTTIAFGSTPLPASTSADPQLLELPAGKLANQVELVTVGNYLYGVVLSSDGSILAWGGGATPGGRGNSPQVVESLAGVQYDFLTSTGVNLGGAPNSSLLLKVGTDWYQWNVNRQSICCSGVWTDRSPTFLTDAKRVLLPTSYSSMGVYPRFELSIAGVLTYLRSAEVSETIELPGSRVIKDIAPLVLGDSSLPIIATDGTIWTYYVNSFGGSQSWQYRPQPWREQGLMRANRFAGPDSTFVVDADGGIWRSPWSWRTGTQGTCASLRGNANSSGARRVSSAGQFGPSWQEDSFALWVDSPSVAAGYERNRWEDGSGWPESFYVDEVTVRPTEQLEVLGYFKSACSGASDLAADWDLDDDGEFETSSSVVPVELGRTYLSTPREASADGRRAAYDGFDSTWKQIEVELSSDSVGGKLDSGRGRFVGLKLSSPFGEKVVRFALIARPVKPAGRVGVSINSAARFTSSSDVTLGMVWPEGTTTAIISNDGSFADAQEIPVAESIRWRLPSEGSGLLPATVYVRFKSLGSDGDSWSQWGEGETNYTDDIIQDFTPPAVSSVSATTGASVNTASFIRAQSATTTARVVVSLDARDDASGIQSMQVTTDPAIPGRELPFSRRVTLNADRGTVAVRVKDNMGLWSPWNFARVTGYSNPSNPGSDPGRVVPPPADGGDSDATPPSGGGSDERETPGGLPENSGPSKAVPESKTEEKSPAKGDDPTADAPASAKPIAGGLELVIAPPLKSLPSVSNSNLRIGGTLPEGVKSIPVRTQRPASTFTSAPITRLSAGDAVKQRVSGLPKRADVTATIAVAGRKFKVGSATTSASGAVVLPPIQFKKPGTYVVAITATVLGKPRLTYLKYVVTR